MKMELYVYLCLYIHNYGHPKNNNKEEEEEEGAVDAEDDDNVQKTRTQNRIIKIQFHVQHRRGKSRAQIKNNNNIKRNHKTEKEDLKMNITKRNNVRARIHFHFIIKQNDTRTRLD